MRSPRKLWAGLLLLFLLPFPAPYMRAQEEGAIPPPPDPAGAQQTSAEPSPAGQPKIDPNWNYKAYLKAFKKSKRKTRLTASQFDKLQSRKQEMVKNIRHYLNRKFGWADPRLLQAFQDLPREYFHFNYQEDSDFSNSAYENPARTWPLGWGSALSDYNGQAYMAQLAHPGSKDKVLEVGTGSGYNISLLSRMVKDAYSIEIISPLGHAVSHIFKPLGYNNVHTRVGDGYYGWKEAAPFDIIMFTCVAQFVPPPLFKQLKPGGRIIIPIGQPFKHNQVLYVYRMDRQGRVHSKKYIPVYFIPMKGTMGAAAAQMGLIIPGQKKAKAKPTPKPGPALTPTGPRTPFPYNKKSPAPF